MFPKNGANDKNVLRGNCAKLRTSRTAFPVPLKMIGSPSEVPIVVGGGIKKLRKRTRVVFVGILSLSNFAHSAKEAHLLDDIIEKTAMAI